MVNSLGGVDSDGEYARPDQTIVKESVPETVVGSIASIIRDICCLCQEDNPLCREVLDKLKPMCDDSTKNQSRVKNSVDRNQALTPV